MDNKNQQIQNTVNMMAECLRDNANAHLLAVLVGDGATFTMGGTLLEQLTLLTSLELKVEEELTNKMGLTSADFVRVMADLRSEIRKEEGM